MTQLNAAIVGPGNIGTDLMYKALTRGENISIEAMVGILPVDESEGLQAAQSEGIQIGTEGIDSVREFAKSSDIDLVFEATSAKIHANHAPVYDELGLFAVDLTPAAVGPFTVPVVNFDELPQDANNVNMITCGGQATIPIVHAVNRVADVGYAEIVATIASKSAGQGTRQNIDEFTQTTSKGLEQVGGASEGKAIIILNPAEPPIMMRNTIYTEVPEESELEMIRESVSAMEGEIQSYVPGYEVALEPRVKRNHDLDLNESKIVVTVIEVEGEGHHLPAYAGNLDIMTSAALGTAERLASDTLSTTAVGE